MLADDIDGAEARSLERAVLDAKTVEEVQVAVRKYPDAVAALLEKSFPAHTDNPTEVRVRADIIRYGAGEQKAEPASVISVYIDDGTVFEYDMSSALQVREHTHAIVTGGYRSVRDGVLTHFPPHRILKVKATGQTTNYPDRVRGT